LGKILVLWAKNKEGFIGEEKRFGSLKGFWDFWAIGKKGWGTFSGNRKAFTRRFIGRKVGFGTLRRKNTGLHLHTIF